MAAARAEAVPRPRPATAVEQQVQNMRIVGAGVKNMTETEAVTATV